MTDRSLIPTTRKALQEAVGLAEVILRNIELSEIPMTNNRALTAIMKTSTPKETPSTSTQLRKVLLRRSLLFSFLTIFALTSLDAAEPNPGLLKQHARNWRYFDDGTGKPVYLVSSHTWMADLGSPGWPQADWDANKLNKYLDFNQYWNLNFIRTWMWEHDAKAEGIWVKNAQGKFDLNQLNQAYFDRLHAFVREAEKRHIYVGVMLFPGFQRSPLFQCRQL